MEKIFTKKTTTNKKVKFVTKNSYELMFGNDCPKKITSDNKYVPIAGKGHYINGVKII
jgi:hypothetical protein